MADINDIWRFDLRRGNSDDARNGACLLDAVSWLEYGRLGDHPTCVCPVVAAFGRGINDAMSDAGRQRLKVYIPQLVGTVDPAAEQARSEYLAWQAIRVFVPLALDAAGLSEQASSLRNLPVTPLATAATAARAAAWAAARTARAATTATTAAWAAAAAAAEAAEARGVAAATAAARAAAWTAARTARTPSRVAASDDAMIAALDGVLAIGLQAELIPPARLQAANRRFALARS